MIPLRALLLVLAAILIAPAAFAQDGPSRAQWAAIDRFIDTTLGSGRSGVAARLELGAGAVASLTPAKASSRATGALCSNCRDPCRGFDLTVDVDDGATIYEYEGRGCALGGDYTRWALAAPPELVRTLRAKPPGPDPALAAPARGLLAALAYLEFGASEEAFTAALDEFRRDAKRGRAGTPLGEADLTALRETFERSRAGTGDCGSGLGTRFVACGTAAN